MKIIIITFFSKMPLACSILLKKKNSMGKFRFFVYKIEIQN